MDNLLLVDIGGTNMRHAVANPSNDNISEIEKSSFDPENFDSFLEKLINKHDSDVLILSVAGPKINNVISMTNQEYTFDPIKIKDKFSIKECFLLNDWEAIAYSYDFIKDSVEYIKKGEPFNQNRLFVGPGTGLGAALSINNQTVLPTEIGNTTNASSLLQKNFNLNNEVNLNLEKIISGTAIASIYNLKTGNTISSEKIFEKFIKNDADAVLNTLKKENHSTRIDYLLALELA